MRPVSSPSKSTVFIVFIDARTSAHILAEPSPSSSSLRRPSGLRRSLDRDFYGPALHLGLLGDRHFQHPVPILRTDPRGVHRGGKRERPGEGAERTLDPKEVLPLHLWVEPALAADQEMVVLNPDVEVLLLHARYVDPKHDAVGRFVNVDWRRP